VTSVTVQLGWASFPDPGAVQPVAARVTVHVPDLAAVTRIPALGLAHITVQPMPGGRFLVVGARSRWRGDGPDRNAVLYDGQVVSKHVLGDGIAHVLATSAGQVWGGYFDEGVYGNCGWARHVAAGRPARPGSCSSRPGWSLPGNIPPERRPGRGSRSAAVMPSTSVTSAPRPATTPIFPVRNAVRL